MFYIDNSPIFTFSDTIKNPEQLLVISKDENLKNM